ncbi:MAG TPA: hypothetical protein VGC13_17655 [Longimicrobium sp.]|jgi:hypothetical protein|uniref:hypothetical protein n=1 Tax=Longimicrobium sp. TaxID=2029185 RepID=UPI002EDABC79
MANSSSSTPGKRASRARPSPGGGAAHACGLCGKTGRLTKTACCDQWICDDEGSYVMFSYARNSCSRNHRRYTLCGYHHTAGHAGDWRTCQDCREEFEPEIYVYYGTNEHNFVTLENPPEFAPTLCSTCGERLNLGEGGYSLSNDGYRCLGCTASDLGL